jgi:DNA end-binding protein Ku
VPESDTSDDEVRARPFWSGVLSFGLVSIPVDLVPAQRTSHAALRQLDADGTPLARRYYCPSDEAEVEADHIVRGYALDDGDVVVVTDEELEALAPEKSREIDLRLFVDRDSIDPLYFERSYFLAPGASSGKAYRLLTAVMEGSRRAGIATFVMRDKEYLVAIFADGGLLHAETMRFHDEVRSTGDVGLPRPTRVEPKALERMRRAVQGLAEDGWDPSALEDPHEPIRKLAARKLAKRKDVVQSQGAPEREGGHVVDLMEVLRASLAQNDMAAKSSRAKSGTAAKRGASKSQSGTRAKASKKQAASRSSRASESRPAATRAPAKRKKSAARRRA